jgi:predicted aminopeptidase
MKFASKKARKWILIALLLVGVAAVSGCQTLGFYRQAAVGQYQIFANQQPVEKVIAHAQTPAQLREQLQLLQQLRVFAETELRLPVNGHYQRYVDVKRPHVVWNVQAAPEFSLEARTWWYPLVGSLEYRGYFSEHGATRYADRLRASGQDVYVGDVNAYSTLGWFKDPVLNTFIYYPESELAEVVFHELAHQRVFARGDTDFNEAFATAVGQEGVRRWLRARGDPGAYEKYGEFLRRNNQVVDLVMNARVKLEELYGDERDADGKIKAARKPRPVAAEQLRRQKQQILAELRGEFDALKLQWGDYTIYDGWFARDLNNAQLNSIANYYDFVPGFEQLLYNYGGDLDEFYVAVERLSHKPREERHEWLRVLAAARHDTAIAAAPVN